MKYYRHQDGFGQPTAAPSHIPEKYQWTLSLKKITKYLKFKKFKKCQKIQNFKKLPTFQKLKKVPKF